MALKPITLRLDEEEFEKLKENLSTYGDPDINVAYVVRSYIRDINRVMPYLMKSEWDLKNYFGFLGLWLRQFVSMPNADMFSKMMGNWWPWAMPGTSSEDTTTEKKKQKHTAKTEGGEDEKQ